MKVSKLIKFLEDFEPDLEVGVFNYDTNYNDPIYGVELSNGKVMLHSLDLNEPNIQK